MNLGIIIVFLQHKTLQENGIRPMKDVELQEKITDKTDNIKKIEKVTRRYVLII